MKSVRGREKREDDFDRTSEKKVERREDKRVEDIRSQEGGGRGGEKS